MVRRKTLSALLAGLVVVTTLLAPIASLTAPVGADSTNLAAQGCTPGFWGNNGGGGGTGCWDVANDPQWAAAGGDGTNPFTYTTPINTFFPSFTDSRLNGVTMWEAVNGGGGSDPANKAARDLVAGYLNAAFGLDYALSTTQLKTAWYAAVQAGDSGLDKFHTAVDGWNTAGCPFGSG